MLNKMHEREQLRNARMQGVLKRLNNVPDTKFYNRWLHLVGIIGSYDVGMTNGYLVRQTVVEGGFKVVVEAEEDAETVS